VTLATPSQYLELRYYARANQTPTSSGTYYGSFLPVFPLYFAVRSETGSINAEEITKDIVGIVTTLNTDTRFIFEAGTELSLVPFLADNFQSAADVLEQAVSQGDGAYNRWGWYCVGSERAYVPDGKPMLVVAQYANTSDYDYLLSLDDENLVPPLSISQDFDSIANWIVVQYTNSLNVRQWLTPDDAAALKDDTSINAYGRRGYVVTLPGTSTSTIATAVGQRYLATFKDPQYRVTSPITVVGYIRGKGGLIVPASEIRAGFRLRIENYVQDVTGSGQGLTFVVTATSYENDSETCQLTTGVPEAPLLLRDSGYQNGKGAPPPINIPIVRTVTYEMLRKMGLTRAQWAKMSPKARRAAKKRAGL
jgi:hypothetical protein